MNKHGSINRIYRLVWDRVRCLWQVAPETARGQGKCSGVVGGGAAAHAIAQGARLSRHGELSALGRSMWQAGLLSLALLGGNAHALDPLARPQGGVVVGGAAQIAPGRDVTTITQASNRAVIDWRSFDVGADHAVRFQQPTQQAAVLNRVIGPDASKIMGKVQANGQVYLVNSAGVMIGKGAQVNVGGLVASTLNISNEDFMQGHDNFAIGRPGAEVTNEGTITAREGGKVVLIGGKVTNTGTIVAPGGDVALAAGRSVQLSAGANGRLKIAVDAAEVGTLVKNGGMIQADGGQVVLTAKGANALASAVVSNTGTIQARTVASHEGRILLTADTDHGGRVELAGKLDASAPDQGRGGSIETSAAQVQVAAGAQVGSRSAQGQHGNWLISQNDMVVTSGAAAQGGAGIDVATVRAGLDQGNVELKSAGAAPGQGKVRVNAAVNWNADTRLTLSAADDIEINAAITATGANAGLTLNHGGHAHAAPSGKGDYYVNAAVTLAGANASLTINGDGYGLARNMDELVAYSGSGRVALAHSFEAPATAYSQAVLTGFGGTLAGMGNSIRNLKIDGHGPQVGLIGSLSASGVVRDLTLEGGWVVGRGFGAPIGGIGALAGTAVGQIRNVRSSVNVSGSGRIGGLVGELLGPTSQISDSHVSGTVVSDTFGPIFFNEGVGGLVGRVMYGTVTGSSATGRVSGSTQVGGLVGSVQNAIVTGSHASGDVSGSGHAVGGLVGQLIGGYVLDSYAAGKVSGSGSAFGGLIGLNSGHVSGAYALGDVSVNGSEVGGLVGFNAGTIEHAYAAGRISGSPGAGALAGYNEGVLRNVAWAASGTSPAVGYNQGIVIEAAAIGPRHSVDGYRHLATEWHEQTPGNGVWLGSTARGGTWVIFEGHSGPFLLSEHSTTIRNVHQLQLMALDLDADYRLAHDIDAGATAAGRMWSDKGFASIARNSAFGGSLDGQGHAIHRLNIDTPDRELTGLFSELAVGAQVVNLKLVDAKVRGGGRTGMLVGRNHGVIDNVHVQGTVSGAGRVGGLAGTSTGVIANSHSSGSVHSTDERTGGLVGVLDALGVIAASSSSANVVGTHRVGGLVGNLASGTITGSRALGTVQGGERVGGLVGVQGLNTLVADSSAAGAVTGKMYVGGLVGRVEDGTIIGSSATGKVSGVDFVGGLAGTVSGTIQRSSAWGDVVATGDEIGGLVGNTNGANFDQVFATGAVVGRFGVGGLIGNARNQTLTNAYALGNVIGEGRVGGLIGRTQANSKVSYVHAAGRVAGNSDVGGLIGVLEGQLGNASWDVAASGVGKAVGTLAANAISQFSALSGNAAYQRRQYAHLGDWAETAPGSGVWVASNGGGTKWIMVDGHTRPFLYSEYSTTISNAHQLQLMAFDLGGHYVLAQDIDARATQQGGGMWRANGFSPVGKEGHAFSGRLDGQGHVVRGLGIHSDTLHDLGLFGRTDHATIVNVGLEQVDVRNGQRSSSTTGGLVGHATNTLLDKVHAAGTVSGLGNVGGLVGRLISGDVQNAYFDGTAQGSIAGGLVGQMNDGSISYSYATGLVRGDAPGLNAMAGGLVGWNAGKLSFSHAANKVEGVPGQVQGWYGAVLGYNDQSTMDGRVFWSLLGSGQMTAVGSGNAATGAFSPVVGHNEFTPDAYWGLGDWRETAQGSGVFVAHDVFGEKRWVMFAGSTRPMLYSEYSTTIRNAHQLQLMGLDLTADYTLAWDIDASATAGPADGSRGSLWSRIGFTPIGGSNLDGLGFSGSLDGNNHVVRNLHMGVDIDQQDTSNRSFGGLIGYLTQSGLVQRIGLEGGVIDIGNAATGALVGENHGVVRDAYSTARVGSLPGDFLAGIRVDVGGLVGRNFGLVESSYARGDVGAGFGAAGGLVGWNAAGGTVRQSYASGAVTHSWFLPGQLGGLVGNNAGVIEQSYFATTNQQGHAINSGPGYAGYGEGKTAAELADAKTFADWDISAKAGAATAWRMTANGPVRTSFLKLAYGRIGNGERVYDGTTNVGDLGFALTDAGAVIGTPSLSLGSANAGTHQLDWGVQNLAAGYDLVLVGGQYKITPRGVTVTVGSGSSVYGDTGQSAPQLQIDGVLASDSITKVQGNLRSDFTIGATTHAGSYQIGTTGSLASGNYKIDQVVQGDWQVERRKVSVTADSGSSVYGDVPLAAPGYSSAGMVNGDDIRKVFGLGVQLVDGKDGAHQLSSLTNAGQYQVVLTGELGDYGNYELVKISDGNWQVERRKITVTAGSGHSTYGDAIGKVPGVSTDGLVNGDSAAKALAGLLAGVVDRGHYIIIDGTTNAGEYGVVVRGDLAADGNYVLDGTVDGGWTVNQRGIVVTAGSGSSTYGDQIGKQPGVTTDGLVNGDSAAKVLAGLGTGFVSGGDLVSMDGTNNAGSYGVVVTGDLGAHSNYVVTEAVDGQWTVDRRGITVTVGSGSSVYGDGVQNMPGLTASGLVNGDSASKVLAGMGTAFTANGKSTITIDGKTNAGQYGVLSTGYLDNFSNYVIDQIVDGSWTVEQRKLVVTAGSGHSTYGDAIGKAPGVSTNGLVNGDDASKVLAGLSAGFVDGKQAITIDGKTDAGQYGVVVNGKLAADGNYVLDDTIDGSWTVDRRQITVVAGSGNSTYGDAIGKQPVVSTDGLVNGDSAAKVLAGLATGFVDGKHAITIDGTTHAGQYGVVVTGELGQGSNYVIAKTQNGQWTVDRRGITVTVGSGSSVYGDGVAAMPGLTASGLVNGDSASKVLAGMGTAFTANGKSTITIDGKTNAGQYGVLSTGYLDNFSNYVVDKIVDGTWTVEQRKLVVTAGSGQSTYGDAIGKVPGVSTDGLVNGDSASKVLAGLSTGFVDGKQAITIDGKTNAGQYGVVVNGKLAADGNYVLDDTVDGSWTVDRRQLVVTAGSGHSTYGDVIGKVPGVSTDGLVNGDDAAKVLAGLATGFVDGKHAITIDGKTDAGSYGVVVTGELGQGSNYVVSKTQDGKWTVDRRGITVTVGSGSSVYGDGVQNMPGLTATGLVNGDSASKVLAGMGTAFTANGKSTITIDGKTNAGQYGVLSTGYLDNFSNYVIDQIVDGSWTVEQRKITVTAGSGHSTYGDAIGKVPGVSTDGLVNGDNASKVLAGLSTGFVDGRQALVIDGKTNAGQYGVIVKGQLAADGNYVLDDTVDGSWTVDRRQLVVTAGSGHSTYGDAIGKQPGVSTDGLVNGDDAAKVLAGLATGFVDGKHAITIDGKTDAGQYGVVVTGDLGQGSNYVIAKTQDGQWTVDRRGITVTVGSGSSVYGDGITNLPGLTASGLVNDDSAAKVLAGMGTAFTANGKSTITIDGKTNAGQYGVLSTGYLDKGSNYVIDQIVDGSWTVEQRKITVTAGSGQSIYGDAIGKVPGVSTDGLVNGDSAAKALAGLSTGFVDGKHAITIDGKTDAGQYDVIVKGQLAADGNYVLDDTVDGSWTVDRRKLVVTAGSGHSTYGDAVGKAPGVSTDGLVNGDDMAKVLAQLSTDFAVDGKTAAGAYAVKVRGKLGEDSNYVLDRSVDGQWQVERRQITVQALGGRSVYGDVIATAPGFTAANLAAHDTLAALAGLSNSFGIDAFSQAGEHKLTVVGALDNANYELVGRHGALWTVDRKQIVVTANGGRSTYGDAARPNPGFTAEGLVNGQGIAVLAGLSSDFAITPRTGAGSHAVQVIGELGQDSNYEVVQRVDGSWQVDRKLLQVIALGDSKRSDGLLYQGGNGVRYEGFVNGEDASALAGSLVYGGSAQGARDTGLYRIAVAGLSSANYDVQFEDGVLDIGVPLLQDAPQASTLIRVTPPAVVGNAPSSTPTSRAPNLDLVLENLDAGGDGITQTVSSQSEQIRGVQLDGQGEASDTPSIDAGVNTLGQQVRVPLYATPGFINSDI